ncbi:MAG TPA: recombination mediator RecR [Williamwhitmania sp.]|nr:recombination mediator RecR [Williamwhitmania sp.]
MNLSHFPSKYLENAVEELAKLPGIGKKTALRLALHLLKQPEENVTLFGTAIVEMRSKTRYCHSCHNISDSETCDICASLRRDHSIVCVVESVRDVMSVENTGIFNGIYHVLGGIISPMDGIGPADLNIESLINKIAEGQVKEVILALSTTMEGETTNFYIFRKIRNYPVSVTTIARGVGFGDELEYTDEVTLSRSIKNRIPFDSGNNDL